MKGNVLNLLLTTFTHIQSNIDSKGIEKKSLQPCILNDDKFTRHNFLNFDISKLLTFPKF